MPEYKFVGPEELYYPTLSLTASPGDVADLDSAPDANWQLVEPLNSNSAPTSTTQE